ncbi:glycosyltransferase family A protein [Hydrogenophaga sp.]|uniref:glycosyltransferase family 2 protein n=1 Tax=Hydrogenophaga sp. TaxID=1904254 RepID=UPI002734593D|nr:glycosyltransferase family A protein [Hydrogenophaga sp.]
MPCKLQLTDVLSMSSLRQSFPRMPISVGLVIPVFNRAHLIQQTIESALAQSTAFDEIIVIDDGSTDNIVDVIAGFGEQIQFFRQPNQGVQIARNYGVSCCTCEWVVLCDSDDLLMPSFLERFTQWSQSHPSNDVIYCNFHLFGSINFAEDKLASCPFDYLKDSRIEDDFAFDIPDLLNRNLRFQPFFSSGCMIRRSFFKALNGYDSKFNGIGAEDWDFTLRAIVSGRVAFCLLPLLKIRRHSGNDSANQLHMSLGEIAVLRTSGFREWPLSREDCVEVARQISIRSTSALNSAFAAEQFDLVIELYSSINSSDRNWRHYLKFLISLSPGFVRRLVLLLIRTRQRDVE